MTKNNIDGFITKKQHNIAGKNKDLDIQSKKDGFTSSSSLNQNGGESDYSKNIFQKKEGLGSNQPDTQDSDSTFIDGSNNNLEDKSNKKRGLFGKRNFRFSKKKNILLALLVIAFPVFYFGYKYASGLNKITGGNIASIFNSTKLKGESEGRVNILISGTSEDDPGHEGADLTDSVMVVSINTIDKSVLMLSLPRDLWINYEDNNSILGSQGKLNEAYFRGKEQSTKNNEVEAGMNNLSKVVTNVTGFPIHYYIKINYQAFRDAVNAVGGVDINIDSGDPYCVGGGGIYDPYAGNIKLKKGLQHLDGEQALNLSRARNDGGGCGMAGSDFSRTEYQRKIMIELRKKALSLGVLSNPSKVSDLLDSVGNNINHSFEANEIIRLYELGKDINETGILSEGLSGDNELINYQAPNGASALTPKNGTFNYASIKFFIRKLTSNDPVVKEEPKVVVLNGTNISGLASKKSDNLTAIGVEVVSLGNAPTKDYQDNQIIVLNKDKPASLKLLQEKISPVTIADAEIEEQYKGKYDADFVIIVGNNDQQSKENQ
jgi:LCP family protein required for cell wall assembly